MKKFLLVAVGLFFILALMVFVRGNTAEAAYPFKEDSFSTSLGKLKIGFIGRASLMFSLNDKIIYVDPYSKMTSYSNLPKADAVVITHEHLDHCDPEALKHIVTKDTQIILNGRSERIIRKGTVLKHGESKEILGVLVEAVPAYDESKTDNGYIFNFGDLRIYVAGDTRVLPEHSQLKNIDVMFFPFYASPESVAGLVRLVNPKIFYPYHIRKPNTTQLRDLLRDTEIDIRVRNMNAI